MPIRNCKHCLAQFTARQADINRGWARFCSKSCKAKEQESRTHQHRLFKKHVRSMEESDFYAGMDCQEAGWDGHKD